MEKGKIAEAAVNLRIATRKACITQSEGRKKGTLSLDAKILFLIKEKPLTPNTIIDMLDLQKSNLACLASGLESADLSRGTSSPQDARRPIALRKRAKNI